MSILATGCPGVVGHFALSNLAKGGHQVVSCNRGQFYKVSAFPDELFDFRRPPEVIGGVSRLLIRSSIKLGKTASGPGSVGVRRNRF